MLLRKSSKLSGTKRHRFDRRRAERADRQRVEHIAETFGITRGRKLIRHVYTEYPYYAVNSEIRSEVLSRCEQDIVESSRPTAASGRLFTIGYEGKTLERFLNQLIQHRVRVLCDVRRNPVSMKFGFSKNPLRKAVNAMGFTPPTMWRVASRILPAGRLGCIYRRHSHAPGFVGLSYFTDEVLQSPHQD